MSTHTGEVLEKLDGSFDSRSLTRGTFTLGSEVRTSKKTAISWLFLKEIVVYPQSDFCLFGSVLL